jgi:hypothetical protein
MITDLVVMVTIINVWCMSLIMKMLEKQSLLGSDKNKKLFNFTGIECVP